MATENIIMGAVKQGGDRQELHERIRVHSMEAARQVKMEGRPNDLLERIADDPMFGLDHEKVRKLVEPSDYVGRAPQQVTEFLSRLIDPLLEEYKSEIGVQIDLKV